MGTYFDWQGGAHAWTDNNWGQSSVPLFPGDTGSTVDDSIDIHNGSAPTTGPAASLTIATLGIWGSYTVPTNLIVTTWIQGNENATVTITHDLSGIPLTGSGWFTIGANGKIGSITNDGETDLTAGCTVTGDVNGGASGIIVAGNGVTISGKVDNSTGHAVTIGNNCIIGGNVQSYDGDLTIGTGCHFTASSAVAIVGGDYGRGKSISIGSGWIADGSLSVQGANDCTVSIGLGTCHGSFAASGGDYTAVGSSLTVSGTGNLVLNGGGGFGIGDYGTISIGSGVVIRVKGGTVSLGGGTDWVDDINCRILLTENNPTVSGSLAYVASSPTAGAAADVPSSGGGVVVI